MGKIIYREVRRSDLLALIIDKKFKPVHDRITQPRREPADPRASRTRWSAARRPRCSWSSSGCCTTSSTPTPSDLPEEPLRDTILLFALITSETRLLLSYVERRVLRGTDPTLPLYQVYDSFVYCIPLELKKVVNTELSDISVTRQAESVRTRVENSHGILKDCFQQSIVQLAQAFDPEVDGGRIFPDFTRAARPVGASCATAWPRWSRASATSSSGRTRPRPTRMKERISEFYDHHIKYLMYRDWSGFELFYIEILKCGSLQRAAADRPPLRDLPVTLLREVQKRSILQGAPAREDVTDLRGAARAGAEAPGLDRRGFCYTPHAQR